MAGVAWTSPFIAPFCDLDTSPIILLRFIQSAVDQCNILNTYAPFYDPRENHKRKKESSVQSPGISTEAIMEYMIAVAIEAKNRRVHAYNQSSRNNERKPRQMDSNLKHDNAQHHRTCMQKNQRKTKVITEQIWPKQTRARRCNNAKNKSDIKTMRRRTTKQTRN